MSFPHRKVLRLSGSRVRKFDECAAKFGIEHYLYRDKDLSSFSGFAADVGTAIHHAWQAYIVHKDLEYAQTVLAIRWPWSHPYAQDNRPFWRGMDAVEDLCAQEVSNYEVMKIQKQDGSTIDAIELALELVIPTDYFEVRYTGYVDAVVVHPDSGKPIILDAKTTAMKQDLFEANYYYDQQLAGYAIIVSALVHDGKLGNPIEGHYVGVGTTKYEQWCESVVKTYDKGAALRFIHGIYQKAAVIYMYQKSGAFPRNPAACTNFFSVCKHQCALCDYNSLSQQQYEVQSRITEDAEYTEFKPQFSVTFDAEHMKG